MPRSIDLAGQKFGRLTVIGREKTRTKSGRSRIVWLCECSCGGRQQAAADTLKSGLTKSCGCLQRERTSAANKKHGQTIKRTPTYSSWAGMIQRCTNPKATGYKYWGGRGITVCDRWLEFSAFLEDMGESSPSNRFIDRINNSRGYEPGNCRWATRTEQNNNNRHNHLLTYNGETLTISEWSKRTGIRERLLHARVTRLGWSHEKAITTPPEPKRQAGQQRRYGAIV